MRGSGGDAVELSGVLFPVLTIWSAVGLALVLWYLWALSRLFPRIGLPAAHGWIPVWNQWRLLDRTSLPGWTAVLLVVPVLAIVPYVLSIVAMHRLNRAARLGAEYTVLGAFIPPLWATLLGSELGQDAPLEQPIGGDPAGADARKRDAEAVAPAYHRSSEPRAEVRAATTGGAPARGLPGLPEPADAVPQPYRSQHSTPPSVAPAFVQPTAPAPQPRPEQRADGPPADEPWRELGHGDLPVAPAALRTGEDAETRAIPTRDLAAGDSGDDAFGRGEWWLGLTTEQEYARLAAEEQQPREMPLRPERRRQGFTWPGDRVQPYSAPSEPEAPAAASSAEEARLNAPEVPAPFRQEDPPPFHPVAEIVDRTEPASSRDGDDGDRDDDADDDLERTVVATRAPWARWSLILEDGLEIRLTASDVVIGRKPSPQGRATPLTIPDETRTLSKSHARLRFVGDGWTIEDLESTNGVALLHDDGREEELAPRTETPATPRLIIGTLHARLQREGAAQ